MTPTFGNQDYHIDPLEARHAIMHTLLDPDALARCTAPLLARRPRPGLLLPGTAPPAMHPAGDFTDTYIAALRRARAAGEARWGRQRRAAGLLLGGMAGALLLWLGAFVMGVQ